LHGILSKEVVVKGGDGRESTAEFETLVQSLHEQLKPQDAIERLLVDRVAACYWRLRRAQRFEIGAVREGLDDCKTPLDGPGPNMKKHEATVRHWQMMLAIERHVHQAPVKGRRNPGTRNAEKAHNAGMEISASENPFTLPSPPIEERGLGTQPKLDQQASDGCDPALSNPAIGESEDRFAKAEEAIHEYEGMTEYAEQQDALADSRRPFLAALPADEPLNRLIRYETMLDRQLHRALSELRRRRQWNDSHLPEKPDGTDSEKT